MKIDFSRRKRWKVLLLLGASIISIFFLLFTNYLVGELSKKELAEVKRIADAYAKVTDPNIEDKGEILQIIQSATIPIIVVDKDENIIVSKNLDPIKARDTDYLKRQLRVMGFYNDPIRIQYTSRDYHYIYYKEQQAITLLRFFPYVQLLLIAVFLGVSYFAFNASRLNEQNMVWVGMAKETAHQIGTPLSSLIAWVEYLKTIEGPPSGEVIYELEKDVERLEVITERFSKIGSTPELQEYNVYDVVAESVNYLEKRITRKVSISITDDSNTKLKAMLNKNLFSWVIENLTKNAVDAMSGKGAITFRMWQSKNNIYIDVTDTGKGIPRANWKTVFEPGYTTRKRGWGLGLSLAKRIVNVYHKGEIYIKESELGKGTTFRIKLKRADT